MSWSIEIKPAARQSLNRLPDKIRDAVRGVAGLHSARRASYRVVFRIADERVVEVVRVGCAQRCLPLTPSGAT